MKKYVKIPLAEFNELIKKYRGALGKSSAEEFRELEEESHAR